MVVRKNVHEEKEKKKGALIKEEVKGEEAQAKKASPSSSDKKTPREKPTLPSVRDLLEQGGTNPKADYCFLIGLFITFILSLVFWHFAFLT